MDNLIEKQNAEKLIEKHQPELKAFIRKRVPNKEDADDILQDVFFQLIKTIDNAIDPIERVSAWLYRVARNLIINKGIKKHEEELPTYYDEETGSSELKDFSEVLFGNNDTSPESEYLRSLVWTELENALAELPPEQREIFEITELDGIPVKEISETTGVAVNTLLSRKHYAVKYLRKRLSGLYYDLIYT